MVEFRAMSSLLEQLPKSKEDSPKIVFTPYKDETEMRKGLTNLILEFLTRLYKERRSRFSNIRIDDEYKTNHS